MAFLGLLAIVCLGGGLALRETHLASALAAAVAAAAFGWAAFAAWSYALAIARGDFFLGGEPFDEPGYTAYPPNTPPFFAAVAAIGTVVAMALAAVWFERWRRAANAGSPGGPAGGGATP